MKVDIFQNTEVWSKYKEKRLGASEIPIIMGISPYKTPYRLWQEKLRFREPDAPGPHMLRGQELEPMIRDMVNERLGANFKPAVFVHDDCDWMMASLDGFETVPVLNGVGLCTHSSAAILEIKCNSKENHDEVKKGNIPYHHILQMIWQSIVTGCQSMVYASYREATEDLIIINIDMGTYRDQFDEIQEKAKRFYEMLQTYTPPEKTKQDEKEEFIEVGDEEALHFASKLADCLHELERAKRVVKALEAEKKAFMDALVEYSDDGNFICGPVKMRRVEPIGLVDWKKLCEAKGIDEEEQNKYRKQGIGYWKVDING